jgi:hypothetical protein
MTALDVALFAVVVAIPVVTALAVVLFCGH